jgi:thiamine-phosphate pyrophosphorylase
MTSSDARLHGPYAITDGRLLPGPRLVPGVRAALVGGARIVQYRDKSADAGRRRREAEALRALCRQRNALLIINDDIELALAVGADGIHLGRNDADPAAARAVLGAGAIIGVSCYDQLARAQRARVAGADYVAFGRFFPSRTKPAAAQADPGLIRRAHAAIPEIPIAAIGGITPANGAILIEAGATMLAVIHALFGQDDIYGAAQAFSALFHRVDSPGGQPTLDTGTSHDHLP